MNTQLLTVHPVHPQQQRLATVVALLRDGGVIAYPTDTGYAFGCAIGDPNAITRIARIKGYDESHHYTLLCADLSSLSQYAIVGNVAYRALKRMFPGRYTVILRAQKEVPRRLQHAKKKTVGLRMADHPVCELLLRQHGAPLLSVSVNEADAEVPFVDGEAVFAAYRGRVDAVVACGYTPHMPSTVIDFVDEVPKVLRQGVSTADFLFHP